MSLIVGRGKWLWDTRQLESHSQVRLMRWDSFATHSQVRHHAFTRVPWLIHRVGHVQPVPPPATGERIHLHHHIVSAVLQNKEAEEHTNLMQQDACINAHSIHMHSMCLPSVVIPPHTQNKKRKSAIIRHFLDVTFAHSIATQDVGYYV